MLRLLALGASPKAFRWAPFRAAASWGDARLVRELVEASMPSEDAFEEAKGRALRDGPPEMLDELAAIRSREERREISASVPQAHTGRAANAVDEASARASGGARRL